jgi:hypothetical protein
VSDKRYGDFEMVNGATLNAANDRIKELLSRLDSAEIASSRAYQAVGSLASDFDVFEHPLIQKLLTVLSRQEGHEDLLPWPAKSLDEWRAEARGGVVERQHINSGRDEK